MTEEFIDLTKDEDVSVAPTEMKIDVSEAVGWVSNDIGKHSDLSDRDALGQHPIKSIIGLKDILDEDKTLKTVYSDKIGLANYYKWDSGAYDDYGYFVSLASADTIKICEGFDIFGVTVDSAAFVGGQLEVISEETDEYGMPKHIYTTDNTYALVVTSGPVDVRCASDVVAGNYVVANDDGIAIVTESECGYKVSGVNYKETATGRVLYATISLGVQACTTDMLGQRVKQLETDMDNAEINIATAMRLANEACSMAGASNATSNEAKDKIDNVINVVDKTQETVDSALVVIDKAKKDIDEAVAAAETASNQAVIVANEALAKAGEIEKTVEPIATWEDPESGNVGAEYYIKHIEDGLSTKVEMETVNKLDEENKLLIEKNAESYQQMLSSVDKYSVGEYSQSYGLTLEQARSILKDGMVYIPTKHGNVETHTETYIYNETEKLEKDFTEGYYYIWSVQPDGEFMWSEKIGNVWVNKEHPPAGDAYTYWYDGDKLYLLNDGEWTEVATLAGNVNNRITSIIRQEVDSTTREIINARGSGVSLDERLNDTDATIARNAFWKKDDGTEYVATFRQTAGEGENEGAALTLVAYKTDGSGEVDQSLPMQGASFVVGVDENGNNYIDFKADNINLTAEQISAVADEIDLTGYVTIESLKEDGETIIDGARIQTGEIKSANYEGQPVIADWFDECQIEASMSFQATSEFGYINHQLQFDKELVNIEIVDIIDSEGLYDMYIDYGVTITDGGCAAIITAHHSQGPADETVTVNITYTYKELGKIITIPNSNKASGGLSMNLNSDETGYIITGIGDCEDTDIVIPDTYNDLPVVGIGQRAFYECTDIIGVSIPDSVETIYEDAFYGCAGLTTLIIGDGVESIEDYAFAGCSLQYVVMPNSQGYYIVENVFDNTTNFVLYFKGTPDEFDEFDNFHQNSIFHDAITHFYSKTEPVDANYPYWHYDVAEGEAGSCLNLTDGSFDSKNFKVSPSGNVTATGGNIAGWKIDENRIHKEDENGNSMVGMYSGDASYASLTEKRATDTDIITGSFTPTVGSSSSYPVEYDKEVAQITNYNFTVSSNLGKNYLYAKVENGKIIIGYNVYELTAGSSTIEYAIDFTYYTGEMVIEGDSPIRFYAGTSSESKPHNFAVLEDGSLYANMAQIEGTIKANKGRLGEWVITPHLICNAYELREVDGEIKRVYRKGTSGLYYSEDEDAIETDSLNFNSNVHCASLKTPGTYSPVRFFAGTTSEIIRNNIDEGVFNQPPMKYAGFRVLEDGSLYATAADITGTVSANKGNIGDLNIEDGCLIHDKYSLDQNGLTLTSPGSKIVVGNTKFQYNQDSTVIETSNPLYIRGENDTQIAFMDGGAQHTSGTIYIAYKRDRQVPSMTIKARLSTPCLYSLTTCKYLYEHGTGTADNITRSNGGSYIFTFNKGATESNETYTLYSKPGEYIDYVRFKNVMMDLWDSWIKFTPDVSDSDFILYSMDSFSQSIKNNYIKIQGHLIPQDASTADGLGYNLGADGCQWDNVFARNETIVHSDARAKNTIQPLTQAHNQIFDALRPVSYKLNKNTSDRTHTGLIAQEVKEAVEYAGLTTQDFAAYCEWENDDGSAGCGLRYGEFISLCIDQIQKLKKRTIELEEKNLMLEDRLTKIEALLTTQND